MTRKFCQNIHVCKEYETLSVPIRDLMDEFATAFDQADSVEMLDIYAASEEPIPGIDAAALTAKIGRPQVHYAGEPPQAIAAVMSCTLASGAAGGIVGATVGRLAPSFVRWLHSPGRGIGNVDPTVTASLLGTLNQISEGRFDCGIGRGDSSRRVMGKKPATLETGTQIQVPLFVNIGDVVRVDTRSGDYVSRA